MKIIAFEEHYKISAIAQANQNHPAEQVYAQWQKVGRYIGDPSQGIPPGIYDLGEKRIAAMDEGGIEVQILSHTVPGPEELEPQLALELARQANDAAPHARNGPAESLGAGAQESARNELWAPGFASIEDAIQELRAGHMIVVVDDEDRENEGDLVMAARWITPEAINFMTQYGRGLICLAMDSERLDALQLPAMVPSNTALGGTGFSVSIDAKGPGMTTGISARDRAQTIRRAIDPTTRPEDLARPGHVFPLRCRPGGVLERRGHTEAAVDLASLAGLGRSGVICEILNKDGSMARVPDLVRFCRSHSLKMVTIADLVRYRCNHACYGNGRNPWRSTGVQYE